LESANFNLRGLKFFDRSLAIACSRGREAIVSRFRPILHREDFSEQQWRLLRILYDEHRSGHGVQLTSVDLAARACIHKVSVGRILSALEKRGLTERRLCETDARARIVGLTEEGITLMGPLVEAAQKIHQQIASDFGREDYIHLLKLLNKLAKI
jgi:homoprotocatechuate degradation regulator HpaR